jgi:hypothetical protein
MYLTTRYCIKTNHKLVSPYFGSTLVLEQTTCNMDSFDSPWPRFGGSHHLPPYYILCVCPWDLHSNGFLSHDSQGGVPKLSRFGLSKLWKLITPSLDLWLRWGLKQTYSSLQELFNGVSHYIWTHRDRIDSQLLMVRSQIGSLTPGPSFDHNLGCRCPNGSYEAILNIYTSRPFQQYKEHLNARCFDPCNQALSFQESSRTPSSHFGEREFHPHTCLKVGLWHTQYVI